MAPGRFADSLTPLFSYANILPVTLSEDTSMPAVYLETSVVQAFTYCIRSKQFVWCKRIMQFYQKFCQYD